MEKGEWSEGGRKEGSETKWETFSFLFHKKNFGTKEREREEEWMNWRTREREREEEWMNCLLWSCVSDVFLLSSSCSDRVCVGVN